MDRMGRRGDDRTPSKGLHLTLDLQVHPRASIATACNTIAWANMVSSWGGVIQGDSAKVAALLPVELRDVYANHVPTVVSDLTGTNEQTAPSRAAAQGMVHRPRRAQGGPKESYR